MRGRFSSSTVTVAIAGAAVGVVISASITRASAQATPPALTTPWGEPDLQGIWTDETDTPLQRSPKYATQEFFTDAERAELDRQRSSMQGRERRAERGTVADVAGAYNDVFTPKKRTGARTSRIVDPPNGRLPPLTAEAQRLPPPNANFELRCCKRPKLAEISSCHVAGASTIRRPRRDSRNPLLATTRRP